MFLDKLTSNIKSLPNKARRFNSKMLDHSIMFRSFLSISFFMLSILFFNGLTKTGGDFTKAFVSIFGLILIFLNLLVIINYFRFIARSYYSNLNHLPVIITLNSFLGLILPLFYSNVILSIVMKSLQRMYNYDSFFCEIRCNLVSFYYNNNIYSQVSNLIFYLILFSFGYLFLSMLLRDRR